MHAVHPYLPRDGTLRTPIGDRHYRNLTNSSTSIFLDFLRAFLGGTGKW